MLYGASTPRAKSLERMAPTHTYASKNQYCFRAPFAHHDVMRTVIALGLVLCACGGSDIGSRESESAPVAAGFVGGSEPADTFDRGSAGESGAGESGNADEPSVGSAADESSSAGESAGGQAGAGDSASAGAALGGSAGSEQGGRAGTSGHAGSGAAAAFDCPGRGEHEWTVYTLQPGQCLVNGNESWSGENVCTESTPDDGSCNVDCWPYLMVRVGVLSVPKRIAVLPLFVETAIVECD